MMTNKILIYLFDGFSDWEIAYLTPEINKSEDFDLIYFSKNGQSVTSMGVLLIQPKYSLDDIKAEDVHVLVLPGGTAWEEGKNTEIETLAKRVFKYGNTLAAICAATTSLGKFGFLDNLNHTSNDLEYLKEIAPNYSGEKNYQNVFAVTDQNVITANGIAPIEFAREVFKTIGLYNEADIEKWFQLFKNGIWEE